MAKNHVLRVRLSAEEHEKLKWKAKDMSETLSDYIRHKVFLNGLEQEN
jgi:predicted DNA-binding protein